MNKNLYKFVKIIVFWCIVLVHTNSNYELDVHFRGMTISTEKPTKPVNSRRYHKIIYDNGKYYQIFPFWGGRGRKFKHLESRKQGERGIMGLVPAGQKASGDTKTTHKGDLR